MSAKAVQEARRACARPDGLVAQASTAIPGGGSSQRRRTLRLGRSMADPVSSGESVGRPRQAVGVAAEASASGVQAGWHVSAGGRVSSAPTQARRPAGLQIDTAPTAGSTGQGGRPLRCAALAGRNTRLGSGSRCLGRPYASSRCRGDGAGSAGVWSALAAPPPSPQGRPGGSKCRLSLCVAAPSNHE